MHANILLLALALPLVPALAHAQDGHAADEKAIRDIEAKWAAGWNRHDVPAMVSLMTPDAEFVNLAGEIFHGREEFSKSLEALHSGKVKESVWQTEDIKIKFLSPDIAIVHIHFNTHGERNPDGSPMPPRRGIFTRVEQKIGGKWLIVASQATTLASRATV
jgi:uncharacterized protein (TIGR02246 family)